MYQFLGEQKKILFSMKMILLLIVFLAFSLDSLYAKEAFLPTDVLRIKSCSNVEISPDGCWIAYTVSVPRKVCEKPGSSYTELYLVSTKTNKVKPFITGKVSISSPQWSPDGSKIAFITKKNTNKNKQVWMIAVDGGEAVQVTKSKTSVSSFRWHPNGKQIAYIAVTPKTKREIQLKEKGYDFIYYEENLKHKNLYIKGICKCCAEKEAEQLTTDMTVWSFKFDDAGENIAIAITKKNLIDHKYMFQKIHILNLKTKKFEKISDNPGKLGNYAFSPDGKKLAYTAALERKDHAVSQAFVVDIASKEMKNITHQNF